MTHGRKRDRRSVRLVALVAALVMAVSGYAAGVTFLGTAEDGVPPRAGAALMSTGAGRDDAAGGRSPQVSADGRHLVFLSRSDLPAATPLHPRAGGDRWRVYGRDLATGAVTLLSDPRTDASDPRISADGRVVTYRSRTPPSQGRAPARSAAGTIVVDRAVSGEAGLDRPGDVLATDLAEAPGPVPASFPELCERDCGPRLSHDGATVVYPSVLSPVSPALLVTAAGSGTPGPVTGDLIDVNALAARPDGFGPDDGPFTLTVGTAAVPGAGDLTGEPRLQGQGSGAFRVGTKKCDTSGTCRTTLTFDPARCADGSLIWGRLETRGSTSAGRSSVGLLARCAGRAPAPDCPPGPEAEHLADLPLRRGELRSGPVSGRLLDVGPVVPGRPLVVMVSARGLTGRVSYGTQDCAAVRLVEPDAKLRERAREAGVADPAPVSPGSVLDGSDTGTLYFLVDPDTRPEGHVPADPASAARTYAARVVLTPAPGAKASGDGFSVTLRTVREVVEMRTDVKAGAGFAPGPARLVSVVEGKGTSATRLVDGVRPALSGDGRTVAFTAYGLDPAVPRTGAVVAARFTDDGRHLGSTTVSGRAASGTTADSAAVSSDGRTIAFVRRPEPPVPGEAAQVLVTDERGEGTRTMSTSGSGAPGNADSTRPSLSPDGRVVGFASAATNLEGGTPGSGPHLYVRAVSSQESVARLAGPGKGEDVDPSAVAFDAGGAVAAFTTTEPLADEDANGQPDVYTHAVAGRLAVEPAALDFGTFTGKSATRTAIPLRIANTGPGPVTVHSVTAPPPFVHRGSCVGRTIRAGEVCTAYVSFAPHDLGPQAGTLEVKARTALDGTVLTSGVDLVAVVEEPNPSGGDGKGAGDTGGRSGERSGAPPSTLPDAAALSVSPTVARPGRVVRIQGSGFIPGDRVTLTWGTAGPVQQADVTPEGTLTAHVPVTGQANAGPGSVTASNDRGELLAYAGLLVAPRPR
ncbi:hypothetical protein V5N34_15570 [Streptomyces baarnensis]|uniref:hypothetical protein n=1 Tax=Streptomyces TaxID=1883 RepID=UPI0029A20488|nr:hypothetical protein [Streptomyces sp. ME02-6979.5a]MDX3342615.1 hypothetical protein [Streptomyces sp. ME02-6979.5a]